MARRQAADADSEQGTEAINAQVQATVDAETDQGYFGSTPDPTPNDAYTVSGVTSGARVPTPGEAAAIARGDITDLT